MQDRPTADELLEAVSDYLLRDVLPATTGRVSFHARVAANAIATVRRELAAEEAHFAREWAGLDALLGPAAPPATREARRLALEARNHELARRIREAADPIFPGLVDHLMAVTRDKLAITNPALVPPAEAS